MAIACFSYTKDTTGSPIEADPWLIQTASQSTTLDTFEATGLFCFDYFFDGTICISEEGSTSLAVAFFSYKDDTTGS